MLVLRGNYTQEMYHFDDGTPSGDIMSIEEYLNCVNESSLIDYDGYGHPMKDNKIDHNLHIYPSEGRRHIPLDATHIIWYNK